MEQPSETLAEVTTTPAAEDLSRPTPADAAFYDEPVPNGSPVPKIGIAGAALGGGALLLLVRRRAKRKREQATRRKQVEQKAHAAAGRAKGTAIKAADAIKDADVPAKAKDVAVAAGTAASAVGSTVRTGIDRMADDHRIQVYAITGAAAAWLYLKLAEVRQLRRISRTMAVAN
jgi:N-acetyl-gamma-glutamylphosphate reductase